jgi:hypothetical protein
LMPLAVVMQFSLCDVISSSVLTVRTLSRLRPNSVRQP